MTSYYRKQETADMRYIYGIANGRTIVARKLIIVLFTREDIQIKRYHLHILFKKLHQRLCEIGSFETRHSFGKAYVCFNCYSGDLRLKDS